MPSASETEQAEPTQTASASSPSLLDSAEVEPLYSGPAAQLVLQASPSQGAPSPKASATLEPRKTCALRRPFRKRPRGPSRGPGHRPRKAANARLARGGEHLFPGGFCAAVRPAHGCQDRRPGTSRDRRQREGRGSEPWPGNAQSQRASHDPHAAASQRPRQRAQSRFGQRRLRPSQSQHRSFPSRPERVGKISQGPKQHARPSEHRQRNAELARAQLHLRRLAPGDARTRVRSTRGTTTR